ncbi:MAG: glycine/sarcosine/betaine reductase selenoprotein B family protein [Smithellaceae bacterium]|jgi:D-proline reductase (dithiol) PrdB|nr:glycine/sarcosine/betaine reductase selenoprotein B family protein [Smithellaceae bacterium]
MKHLNYINITRAAFPDQPPYQWTENTSAPWTPVVKPLAESKVVLISSGGIYRSDQAPFDPVKNDITFREIPADTDINDLKTSHDYYDHQDADKDVNCVFPLERLRELAAGGFIRELAETNFTFMGRIFRKSALLNEMIPALIARLKAMKVDLAFLVPA